MTGQLGNGLLILSAKFKLNSITLGYWGSQGHGKKNMDLHLEADSAVNRASQKCNGLKANSRPKLNTLPAKMSNAGIL